MWLVYNIQYYTLYIDYRTANIRHDLEYLPLNMLIINLNLLLSNLYCLVLPFQHQFNWVYNTCILHCFHKLIYQVLQIISLKLSMCMLMYNVFNRWCMCMYISLYILINTCKLCIVIYLNGGVKSIIDEWKCKVSSSHSHITYSVSIFSVKMCLLEWCINLFEEQNKHFLFQPMSISLTFIHLLIFTYLF